MTKRTKPKPPAQPNPNKLAFSRKPDETERNAVGRNAIRATVGGALTIKAYGGRYGDALAVNGLVKALSDQAQAVIDGDLKRAEQLLTVQAHTLDAIFNTLAQRAIRAEYMDNLERYLRLGLKAQGQCRATLETLAIIKNPSPALFIRQQNVGVNQQVNNGGTSGNPPPRARETGIEQSKLWGSNMANGWTPQRRARQRELIRNWKPWERSTGPRTAAGKAQVSRNAYKGAMRRMLRALRRALREQERGIADLSHKLNNCAISSER